MQLLLADCFLGNKSASNSNQDPRLQENTFGSNFEKPICKKPIGVQSSTRHSSKETGQKKFQELRR